MINPPFKTTDTGLATYLMWKGCKQSDIPFEGQTGSFGKKEVRFCFDDVNPGLVTDYFNDVDGLKSYNGIRQHFLHVAKTFFNGESDAK